jgi:hypothetical protein
VSLAQDHPYQLYNIHERPSVNLEENLFCNQLQKEERGTEEQRKRRKKRKEKKRPKQNNRRVNQGDATKHHNTFF